MSLLQAELSIQGLKAAAANGEASANKSNVANSEEKIPRPMNAFMVFSKRQRQRVQEENKGLDNREISRKLGEMWYALPEDEKQSYQQLAQEVVLSPKINFASI